MVQNVLMSKLIPPDPSIYYMRRSKLMKKLAKSINGKLTIVHSGAGFGKTSAIAQLMMDQKLLFSWYTVTEEDDDILPFLRHLFYSIQRVCPTFGESVAGWDRFSMFPKIEELNKLYMLFVNEFCKIKRPLVVIIDDFHLVHHVFQINYILNKIIEHLPSHIHFIVASRVYPSWNSIFQLRMNGQLIECKEEDFIFTSEEVQVLFEDYFGRFLTFEEIEKILSITEGWAIAILLLAMQSNETNLPIEEITNYSLRDFFSYLSEEVFENLEEHQQNALLKFSVFQTFSIDLIEKFYGQQLADQLLELVKHHAFIQPLVGHQEFRFHALFQQFLEIKMKEKDEDGYIRLHKKAVEYFSNRNNPINALYHVYKTKDNLLVAQVLLRFAPFYLNAGQFDYFLEHLKELPEDIKKSFHELYFYEGECQRYRAQYERAKKAYEQCLTIATQHKDDYYVLKANGGIANIFLDTIQPVLAQQYLIQALELANHIEIDTKELYLLKRQYAENLVNLGRAGEAEKWVKAQELPEHVLMKGNLDVRISLRQGKLVEASRLINLREGRDSITSDAHRESDVLQALILTLLGENEKAYIYASNSIRNSERDYALYAEAVGYLRKGHASLILNPFYLDDAERCYLKTIEIMDELHVTRAKAESYMGLSIVKSRQGNLHEAISYAKLGLYETERVQDRWVSALLLTALTIIYVEKEHFLEAFEYAKRANEFYSSSEDKYGEMVTNFWLAYITYREKNEFEFVQHFQNFLELCDEHDYYFFVQKRTLFGPRNMLNFLELVAYSKKCSQSEARLEKIMHVMQLKETVAIPKETFTLQLFGPFTAYRNWIEIDDKEWKREKAKELFLFLFLHRNRFISRDEMMHALWPNSDEQTMNRDFKVAYNACLKVLEPERTAREESTYIIRKQSMYQLNQPFAFISDLENFIKFAELGLEEKDPYISIEWLLKAAYLYSGNLLEGLQYEWLVQKREEMFNMYILVIERLAQSYTRLKQFDKVIKWAEKLVQLDATWEEGYRLLMLSYYHLDNRPLAVKWYEKCVEILDEELNIDPMETTTHIYEMITR